MKSSAHFLSPVCLALFLAALALTSASAVVFTTDTSIGALDTSYDGQDVVVSNCTVTIDGEHAFNSLLLAQGGILTHTLSSNGLSLTITNDLQVESGGVINLAGRGFDGNTGTGNGGEAGSPQSGAGAGHGGYGGLSSSNALGGNCYGVFDQPVTLGSGGGQGTTSVGGSGGGAIKLVIGGSALIEGVISANGANATNSRSGGGSGGSVWITAQTVRGAGTITANGGNGEPIHGGGGGGGRIAIHSDTNNFTGTITAFGGQGWKIGGAGTIYTKPTASTGLLLVDNGGNAGTNSLIALTNLASVRLCGGTIAMTSGGWIAGDVTIESNCVLTVATLNSTLSVTASNLVLHTNSFVLADNNFSFGSGNGGSYGGGAGHGGYGGANGSGFSVERGNSYGSVNSPTASGSRGGVAGYTSTAGNGGGVIRLNISGTLHLDGIVSANGTNGTLTSGSPTTSYYGGSSGGSIWLSAGSFSGIGLVRVNGGDGLLPYGGGGAGGRIAATFNSNQFSGLMTAYGGNGFQYGGAGTVYLKNNQLTYGQLLVDNDNNVGAVTPSSVSGTVDLTVSGSAVTSFGIGIGMRNILVRSNSAIMAITTSPSQVTTHVSGNVTIDEGGLYSVSGMGYIGGQGLQNGAGITPTVVSTPRGGGGHGGYGAMNPNGYGNSYGSITDPTGVGSGGGLAISSTSSSGGAGGGSLRFSFSGTERVLTVNGRLAADGLSSDAVGAGGGAGGSLNLSPYVLAGNGVISVNGGAGTGTAGGGGGGRIAITYNSNLFTGQITAFGGAGSVAGGAGTIYQKGTSEQRGRIIVDNGGEFGTNTPISVSMSPSSRYNMDVGGAAQVVSSAPFYLSNLNVSANGVVSFDNQTSLLLDILRNAVISNGGSIKADGKGYAFNQGPGQGATLSAKGAGGGYGGAGGNSSAGAVGGTNYGSYTKPANGGSRGGLGANTNFGGSEGGGAVQMIVGGTLTVDGSVSANGNPGLQDDSGGGSGGSIWITTGALTGSGNLSATGGDGDLFGGGGGGGGRIAIYSPSNTYAGGMSVSGGFGANSGQAGSIFISTNLLASVISGTVTNLQGNPQQGALIQPTGFAATTTDVNGNYVLELPVGWSGSVTPSLGTNVFVPSTRSYASLNSDIANANFLTVPSVTPVLGSSVSGTNMVFNWSGIQGVNYQAYWSTNLINWQLIGSTFQGSNGVMQLLIPANDVPYKFVRVRAFH